MMGASACLLLLLFLGVASENCPAASHKDSDNNNNLLGDAGDLFSNPHAVNMLSALQKQDQERADLLMAPLQLNRLDKVVDRFYQIVAQPLQTACVFGKRMGGEWLSNCGAFDGEKFVCLDKMYTDIANGNCLVYSFGIADDWTFEDTLGALGCRVRAFDPTIDSPEQRSDNVSFHKLGLGHFNGMTQLSMNQDNNRQVLAPVKTLDTIVEELGDGDKEVSYLKVDVEGSELKSMRGWVESGVLKRVRQIGIELHTGPVHLAEDKHREMMPELIEVMRMMYKEGFRLVSYTPNGCVGKAQDPKKRYYTYFDVVFYKP